MEFKEYKLGAQKQETFEADSQLEYFVQRIIPCV